MRVLIACDKFKGSLTAAEACRAVRDGLKDAGVPGEPVICPVADGGEGFADSMVTALQGEWLTCKAYDALHNPIEARYGMVRNAAGELEAVLEMSEANGLKRIPAGDRNVVCSSTFGTGSMIRHAVAQGAQRILIGIGGSATNDGGTGMAAALGVRFLGPDGSVLDPVPAACVDAVQVDLGGMLELPPIEVACDVENPLLGSNGASAVYGPQKGADPEEVKFLEKALARLVVLTDAKDIAASPGAGAAGGLGFGLMCFAQARLRNGFNMVAEALGLSRQVAAVDLVITGEGSLDEQTLQGKAPMGLAVLAREHGKKVIGIGGQVDSVLAGSPWFDATLSLESFGLGKEECMIRAEELVRNLGGEVAGLLRSWEDA